MNELIGDSKEGNSFKVLLDVSKFDEALLLRDFIFEHI